MNMFKTDLFRSFAVGFVLGIGALFLALGSENDGTSPSMVGHALAAPAVSN